MRCIFLRSLMLSIAVLVVLAARVAVGDEIGSPSAPPSGEIQVFDSTGGTPTPAHRNASPAERLKSTATKPASVEDQQKSPPSDEPLKPVVDPDEVPPVAIEATSFKGVAPGTSTKEDVLKAWGKPKKTSKANGVLVQLYSIEPFNRVEVNYAGDKVSSVVIRLERPFPAETVVKHLDLAAIRPAVVVNELGEVLGRAYPERGVLFAFEPSEKGTKPATKVSQIVLEPISAEPFVLRAEATLTTRNDLSCHDLEQALTLEPGNARAHWLYSRALSASEQHKKSVKAASEAVRFDPDNAQYRITYAQALAQTGQIPEAAEEARKALTASDDRPHVKARAMCLVGDLMASGAKPDFAKALGLHTQAIQLADPLASDPHPAIRMAAKEVLIDAHLSAAHDIAWGDWKDKSKAVARWLDRAEAAAVDIVSTENGGDEQLFRVYTRSLAAYVGVRGDLDPAPIAKSVVTTGERLIAAARDPGRKAQLQWELGMSLYDAVQVCQMRSEPDVALKHGENAAQYLAAAVNARPTPASSFLLGRLYFRMGTIYAMRDRNHKAAVQWFDKAVPLMEQGAPDEFAGDLGRQGESLVSMGVSYWEIGQRDKAVELTQNGIKWMEQAAKQGTLDRSSLAVPYGNLAAMHRKLGANEKADRYQEMAGRLKAEKMK